MDQTCQQRDSEHSDSFNIYEIRVFTGFQTARHTTGQYCND